MQLSSGTVLLRFKDFLSIMAAGFVRFRLRGPIGSCVYSLLLLVKSAVTVAWQRMLRGPLRPSWGFEFEAATHFFQAQDARVSKLALVGNVARCRQVVDSLVFRLPVLERAHIINKPRFARSWLTSDRPGPTILYFHGGGYAFYPAMTDNVIAAIAAAAGGRVLVPHYPLAPERPFPAQLDYAESAYRWLLDSGVAPSAIVMAGDSAGAHLMLSLLLRRRTTELPKPSAAIAISPWTDPRNGGASMQANSRFDWMSPAMSLQLAKWAGPKLQEFNLALWPHDRDLAELPPLLVHGGEVEICRDMIEEFCTRATRAGADVTYQCWPDMNHNFHGFGDRIPQSDMALRAIAAFVAAHGPA